MALVKWSPFRELDDFDRFFDVTPFWRGMTKWLPPADISEDKDNVYVEAELPGIEDPGKVNVSVENDVLTVDVKEEKKKEVEERAYSLKERKEYVVHRSWSLPTSVDGDRAKAVYKNGILTVTVPKREEVKPKPVKVEVK